MTKTQLKAKIGRVVLLALYQNRPHNNIARIMELKGEINAQIDLMYQGAADDEEFDDEETCSFCGTALRNIPMEKIANYHWTGECEPEYDEYDHARQIEDKMDEIAARYDD